jgi:hypothetical protein
MILCSRQPNLKIPWANKTSVRCSKLKDFQPEELFSAMLHEQHVKGKFLCKYFEKKRCTRYLAAEINGLGIPGIAHAPTKLKSILCRECYDARRIHVPVLLQIRQELTRGLVLLCFGHLRLNLLDLFNYPHLEK